jgi:hypothetical protein
VTAGRNIDLATSAGIVSRGNLYNAELPAGDIDLIAPRGTVNAGDAGIRPNNLNIAAQVVLGADNIAVAGTSTGTPVADASAVTATTSGATQQGTTFPRQPLPYRKICRKQREHPMR